MAAAFITQNIWPEITKVVRHAKKPCHVAVAYFGAGASSLLPLPRGSRLVVNASEKAVGSGQTCPEDLLKLLQREVSVYSVANLHAKVYVVGRTAYIGSNNVSHTSATRWMEAAVRITDSGEVSSARKFVDDLCLDALTPGSLKKLAKLYQAPKFRDGNEVKKEMDGTSNRPALPRLLLAQLELIDWSEREQELHDAELLVAKKQRKHSRTWIIDGFSCYGKCRFQQNDIVLQVTDEGNGNVFITPPGKVIHVRPKERVGNKLVSFVFVERPDLRRRRIENLAKNIGCEERKLKRDGLVQDRSFVQTLLNTWVVKL